MFQNGGVLSVKNVQFLLICVFLLISVLQSQLLSFVRLFIVFGRGDLLDSSECSSSVHSSLNHFFMDFQGVFLVLVQVAVLTLELPHHQHLFSVWLYGEGVTRVVLEIVGHVLRKTKRWEFASVVVLSMGGSNFGATFSVLVLLHVVGRQLKLFRVFDRVHYRGPCVRHRAVDIICPLL